MRLAKTNEKEIDSLMKVLLEIEAISEELKHTELSDLEWEYFPILSNLYKDDSENFLENTFRYLANIHFQRILWNCSTMLEQCADENLSYLDFNSKIKKGFELYDAQFPELKEKADALQLQTVP